MDRAVLISFGYSEKLVHIIFEVYSGGNIILLNSDLKIMALLRPYETSSFKVDVGETYVIERRETAPLTKINKFKNPI
ncbi:hypothetical protein MHBO_003212 [Bonamia ostreae]|uniref:Uncharacterized protein n=1 Tax=Bonamia ostreae TaxID=126728 RepID=A0ABV2APS7_9EUKA